MLWILEPKPPQGFCRIWCTCLHVFKWMVLGFGSEDGAISEKATANL